MCLGLHSVEYLEFRCVELMSALLLLGAGAVLTASALGQHSVWVALPMAESPYG